MKRAEFLQKYFRAWNRFYRCAIIKKLRVRSLLKHLNAKRRGLLSNCLLGWRGVVQRKERNKEALINFVKSRGTRLCQKMLFSLQRNLRSGFRKNLLKLDQKRALLEADMVNSQKICEELGNEKFEAIERQKDVQKATNEIKRKLELKEKENVSIF